MVGKSLLHALSVAQAEKIRDRTLPLLQFFGYEVGSFHWIFSIYFSFSIISIAIPAVGEFSMCGQRQ